MPSIIKKNAVNIRVRAEKLTEKLKEEETRSNVTANTVERFEK
jgi:hypothetical protein